MNPERRQLEKRESSATCKLYRSRNENQLTDGNTNFETEKNRELIVVVIVTKVERTDFLDGTHRVETRTVRVAVERSIGSNEFEDRIKIVDFFFGHLLERDQKREKSGRLNLVRVSYVRLFVRVE